MPRGALPIPIGRWCDTARLLRVSQNPRRRKVGQAIIVLYHKRRIGRHRVDHIDHRTDFATDERSHLRPGDSVHPTALMPSGMATECDRATNSPRSITSVTLWMVRTRCVRPSRTIVERPCQREAGTGAVEMCLQRMRGVQCAQVNHQVVVKQAAERGW